MGLLVGERKRMNKGGRKERERERERDRARGGERFISVWLEWFCERLVCPTIGIMSERLLTHLYLFLFLFFLHSCFNAFNRINLSVMNVIGVLFGKKYNYIMMQFRQYLSIYLSIYVCIIVCASLFVLVHPSICFRSIYLSIYPHASIYLFLLVLSVSQLISISVNFYLSFYEWVYIIISFCSPIVQDTWVQSQVESYQRLKKWHLMPPRLTLSIIKYR